MSETTKQSDKTRDLKGPLSSYRLSLMTKILSGSPHEGEDPFSRKARQELEKYITDSDRAEIN